MGRKQVPLLFLIILSLSIASVRADSLTVHINPMSAYPYYFRSDIIVSGNVNGNLNDALVGITVVGPGLNNIVLTRTVNTGLNPTSPLVEARDVRLCDEGGVTVTSATAGSYTWVTADVINADIIAHTVLVVFTIFDADNQVAGMASYVVTLLDRYQGTGAHSPSILRINLPSCAVNGLAKIYAGVYTDWPSNGGYPYCQESSSVATITGGKQAIGYTPYATTPGTFKLDFRLNRFSAIGTYAIYVMASRYSDRSSSVQSTTFTAKLKGDFNDNGIVNADDIASFVDYYSAYWSTGVANPAADFTRDGVINADDISQFCDAYLFFYI